MKLFGPFRMDAANHSLWRHDERATITPKAFDVLRYLVEHSDRLVSQEELLEALWPETYVNPEGIRRYILEIRKVLGDPAGKPEFIETLPKRGYQFVASVTDESATLGSNAAQPSGNFVGREAGLKELGECLQKALRGERQVVFVTGEGGIGKTTLVDMFQQQVMPPSVQVARGQCIEGFGGIEAYYPMLEALGSLLRDTQDPTFVQMLAKRAPTWLIQFPALVKPEQKEILQREILGSTRERMVREICEMLEAASMQTPLMVILEDLHWVDPSTLDLISAIARRREPAKLLLLGTYRPVEVVLSQSPLKTLKQDLLVRQLCHEIAIEHLEQSDIANYLAKTFSAEALPDGLTDLIYQNSGGNPLFMVAIVQDMLNKGLIVQDHGSLMLSAPIAEVYPGVPETLQQMLEIQLEQLSADERRILQSGCVSGERFSVWSAAATLDGSPAFIEETCDKLAGRQRFIRSVGIHQAPDGTPSVHYEFRHSLYRQALQRSLTSLNRSRFQLSLAGRLMPICVQAKPELAAEVALRFEEGRDLERAARCWMLAAENAARLFSYRDTIGILRRALDLVTQLRPGGSAELEIQILQRAGDAHYALGEMSDSAAAYERAAELAAQAGLPASHAASLVLLAVPLLYIDADRGHPVCQQAIELSRQLSDPILAAQTQAPAASLRLLYGGWGKEDAEVWTCAHEVLSGADSSGVTTDVFSMYVQALRGDFRNAMENAEALIASTTNPTAYVLAHGAKGLVQLSLGRFGDMFELLTVGRELGEKNGENPWMYIFGEAWLRMLCGDFEGVRRLSQIVMRGDTEPHAAWTRTAYRVSSGYADLHRGNFTDAVEYFQQVLDFQTTPRFFLHWHWRLQARVGLTEARLYSGDLESAQHEADAFLSAALSTEEPNVRARAWETKSRVARARQDRRGARECIEQALTILDTFDIPMAAWQVHRTAWDLCRDEGEHRQAQAHRARAGEFILRIADSFKTGEPLRERLLTAPPVRRIFESVASA